MSKITSEKINQLHPEWEFPEFEIDEINKKKHKYCVCVFVINEGERIQKQLQKMKPLAEQIDIVVADGGSTDGSLGIDFLKSQDVRALLTKKGKGKLSAQMRMAFAWALSEGYEGVVVVDGNGKDSIERIPNFIKLLDQGYDHVQGSRFIPGGKAVNTPLSREVGLHLIHAPLISLAAGKGIPIRQMDSVLIVQNCSKIQILLYSVIYFKHTNFIIISLLKVAVVSSIKQLKHQLCEHIRRRVKHQRRLAQSRGICTL